MAGETMTVRMAWKMSGDALAMAGAPDTRSRPGHVRRYGIARRGVDRRRSLPQVARARSTPHRDAAALMEPFSFASSLDLDLPVHVRMSVGASVYMQNALTDVPQQ